MGGTTLAYVVLGVGLVCGAMLMALAARALDDVFDSLRNLLRILQKHSERRRQQ